MDLQIGPVRLRVQTQIHLIQLWMFLQIWTGLGKKGISQQFFLLVEMESCIVIQIKDSYSLMSEDRRTSEDVCAGVG